MGILQRIFPKSRPDVPATQAAAKITLLGGDVDLAIVGESFCQDALWQISGVHRGEPVRQEVVAVLVPEPQNPYDPNAVRIEVNGLQVGHLSRSDAVRYRDGLAALMERYQGLIALNAVVVGGGYGKDNLGVWLSHTPEDFGVRPAPDGRPKPAGTGGPIRTGLSDALITDDEDDSYDLGWRSDLPDDGPSAVSRLRQLLAIEQDPLDRHFMYNELETRLYRAGLRDPTSMSEYDAASRAHDDEMSTIRSAFLQKWGSIPLLNTYKQMSIRFQKAKDWEPSRWWAERGIEQYGDKPARPEFVTDLESRRDRARAKIEFINQLGVQTKADPRPAPDLPVRSTADAIEVLTCQHCGAQFERLRTTGRKPSFCPSCR